MTDPLYFGCWGGLPGHFLCDPSGRRIYSAKALNFVVGPVTHHIDGSLAPRRMSDRHGGGICWGAQGKRDHALDVSMRSSECQQGQFLLHNLSNGYTAIQWWDRCQGDTRPGCNSTIMREGNFAAGELKDALARFFPVVLANLKRNGVELLEVTP